MAMMGEIFFLLYGYFFQIFFVADTLYNTDQLDSVWNRSISIM